MNEMLSFFTQFLGIVADFLMAEPVKYFTGIFIGCCVIGLVTRLFRLR